MTDRFERFSFITAEIHRHIYKLSSEVMAEFGLRGMHAIYLLMLRKYSEGITAAKLSELCCRNKSDVSRAMTVFLDSGIIVKKGEENNYRATLMLTEKGMHYANLLSAKCDELLALVGKGIPEEQRKNLYECLDIILRNLKEINKFC